MMPSWFVPSELWMRRMIGLIRDHLLAVACYEAPVSQMGDGIPVVDLGRRADAASIEHGKKQLIDLLRRHPMAGVLCHYLPFAIRYEEVWRQVPNPVFVHGHGYDLTWDLRRDGKRFHAADYPQQVRILSQRAIIVANSNGSRDKLLEIGVDPSRVIVKYLGVEVGEYHPPARDDGDETRLLFLGRLVDCKGPVETLRAFEMACDMGLRGRLTIAGDGPERLALDRAISGMKHADRVTLTGAVDEKTGTELRRTHHVFVAHSRTGPSSGQVEALGVAYLEAMSAGLPVVSANGGSIPEIIHHGVSGLLCEPNDLNSHARLMCQIASDTVLHQRLSHGAWETVRNRFSMRQERDLLVALMHQTHA